MYRIARTMFVQRAIAGLSTGVGKIITLAIAIWTEIANTPVSKPVRADHLGPVALVLSGLTAIVASGA
jgi:hypothetical protein